MSDLTTKPHRYKVKIDEPQDGAGDLVFTFVPKASKLGQSAKQSPRYIVRSRGNGPTVNLDWKETTDDPGAAKSDIEKEVQQRMAERAAWLSLVGELVALVEQWGNELGWSTRRIDKQLEDSRIGKHTVPALLMQEDTVRALLEPVSRSVPGGEGLVELSLIPTYNDIASLFYRDGCWQLHYVSPDAKAAATARNSESKPLSIDALAEVLGEMKKHG